MRITDADGLWFTCCATNTADRPIAELELRHRLLARAEDRIRSARATGLRNLPLHDTAQNRIWLEIVQIALALQWNPAPTRRGRRVISMAATSPNNRNSSPKKPPDRSWTSPARPAPLAVFLERADLAGVGRGGRGELAADRVAWRRPGGTGALNAASAGWRPSSPVRRTAVAGARGFGFADCGLRLVTWGLSIFE